MAPSGTSSRRAPWSGLPTFRKLPVLVQAAEDDVDLCPLQGLPGVVNVRTVSDVAAALAAPKAPDLPPDYLALDPELPRWKERLGL